MHEWWVPVVAVLVVGLLLVAVPKLLAAWLLARRHGAAEGQGNDPRRPPDSDTPGDGGR